MLRRNKQGEHTKTSALASRSDKTSLVGGACSRDISVAPSCRAKETASPDSQNETGMSLASAAAATANAVDAFSGALSAQVSLISNFLATRERYLLTR